jgi:hypothetical protein
MLFPVPYIDVVFGIGGIALAAMAGQRGARGLRIAGLIVSIIGTVIAFFYTLGVAMGTTASLI